MPRVFVEPENVHPDHLLIEGEAAHYLLRVLRLGLNSPLTALDGSGMAYECLIQAVEGQRIEAAILSRAEAPEPPIPITLYQGLPKADKLEWIIQKATELGVGRIVPVEAARSVVQLRGDRAQGKLQRWQKIAQEAAEQSERGRVPVVNSPVSLKHLKFAPGTLALVLSERVTGPSLPLALPSLPPCALALFVGPEGGWTHEELKLMREMGGQEVSLGQRILRTETAGLAALAIVMAVYELNERA